MTSSPATYFGGWIYLGEHSQMSFAGDTEAQAKAELMRWLNHYGDEGHEIAGFSFMRFCRTCKGDGLISTRARSRKCPTCRGKNSTVVILDTGKEQEL